MNTTSNNDTRQATREEILKLYGVVPSEQFDAAKACHDRVEYLKRFLRTTGRGGFVLGISGGVDSTAAGRLAQMACTQLRDEGFEAYFHAVRLPAGVQQDEHDAVDALAFIQPDNTLDINIGQAATAMAEACHNGVSANGARLRASEADFHKGNIKARLRMAAQYYVAAVHGAVVLGTDHHGEKIAAFWTRGGDEVCDLLVLNGLNKRQVRLCAKHMGAPEHLWSKAPTADLEELAPGKVDDEGFGYSYEDQSDFLEGKAIDAKSEALIIDKYEATRYRREPPVEFGSVVA